MIEVQGRVQHSPLGVVCHKIVTPFSQVFLVRLYSADSWVKGSPYVVPRPGIGIGFSIGPGKISWSVPLTWESALVSKSFILN